MTVLEPPFVPLPQDAPDDDMPAFLQMSLQSTPKLDDTPVCLYPTGLHALGQCEADI